MIEQSSILNYRSILTIVGKDSANFLQGLISNDIYNARSDRLLYALLLTPQGKILCDMFIIPHRDGFLLDCPKIYVAELSQKLSLYKLRQDVTITESPEYQVIVSNKQIDNNFMIDPRASDLGYRSFSKSKDYTINDEVIDWYQLQRMKLKIPEAEIDFMPSIFFPIHLGLNLFNAIDYNKGCYVGQEVTARSTYRSDIKKKIYYLQFKKYSPKSGLEIFLGERRAGIVLGCHRNFGLALLDVDKVEHGHSVGYVDGAECLVQ